MEEKMLTKLNAMAQDAKAHHDRYGHDGTFLALYNQLLSGLQILQIYTGKEYVINSDGTVKERG